MILVNNGIKLCLTYYNLNGTRFQISRRDYVENVGFNPLPVELNQIFDRFRPKSNFRIYVLDWLAPNTAEIYAERILSKVEQATLLVHISDYIAEQ